MIHDEGLLNIRAAILRQAVKDYEEALREKNRIKAWRLERFFTSEWGELLSGGHGDYIITECKKRIGAL